MKKIPVSRDGLERLKVELEQLKLVRRPEIAAIVAEARSHGDLRENSAYDAARETQMMNEKRIRDLESQVRSAVIMEEGGSSTSDSVVVGMTVVVDFDGEEERYTIVGAIEAKPSAGRISNESPLGKALLGKREGQIAQVPTPGGMHKVKIVRIER